MPGLMRTRGFIRSLLFGDTFNRLDNNRLEQSPNADGGGVWTRMTGYLGENNTSPNSIPNSVIPLTASSTLLANATGFYALASGSQHGDVEGALDIQMGQTASGGASGAVVEWWTKGIASGAAATVGVRAKLVLGPSANHHLALISHGGAGTTLHASAGLGGSTASAFYTSQKLTLVARIRGNLADVWLATGALAATPILSATHANLSLMGHPMLDMRLAAAHVHADNLAVYDLSGGASDIGPREWFRFESHPRRRAFQGNASQFTANREAEFRGDNPQLIPVGSPGASGPARVIVFAGDPDDFLGNDLMDVRLDVVERFRFLR